jgi:phage replication O-like protein O
MENGWTGIANELLEAIIHAHFTSRQYAVILAVIRKTYGVKKRKVAAISLTEISQMAGISLANASRTVNELIDMHVIQLHGIKTQTRVMGINKNYDEWSGTCQNGTCQNGKSSTCQDGKSGLAKMASDTIERKIKEKGKERDPLFLGLWEMYPTDKRYGLQYISAEVEEEVVMHADAVKTALEIYVAQTDHKYLCKASKFFEERWKLVNPPAAVKDEEDDWQ